MGILEKRVMTEFTILHHGVPLGTASTAPDQNGDHDHRFALNLMDFAPAPAYESIRPLARLAAESFLGGFFSPLVDLKAADAAMPAAKQLWAELELADVRGNPVAGRIVWLIEDTIGGNPSYWVDVELDDASSDVPARPRVPPHGGRAHNHPPPNAPGTGSHPAGSIG